MLHVISCCIITVRQTIAEMFVCNTGCEPMLKKLVWSCYVARFTVWRDSRVRCDESPCQSSTIVQWASSV